VIDSEGYIYGYLGNMEVRDDDVIFEVYEEKEYATETVDEELLIKRLIDYLKERKRRLFKKITINDLKNEVKRNLDIDQDDIDLNSYVEYAKKVGIEIPLKSMHVKRKYAKGTISYRDILALIVQHVPNESGTATREYKIVLLNKPKQAMYGGVEIKPQPPLIPPKRMKGKLVVSKQGLILGYVDGISIAPSVIAIRVKIPQVRKRVLNLQMFARYYEGYEEYSEYIEKLKTAFKEEIVDINRLEEIIEWMRQRKYPKELIDSIKEFTEDIVVEEEKVEDIPWSRVAKVGDVVIVEE
ncbi:MAG: hypothetical protein DRN53_02410, partial [Thermoprotei archaeon]